MYILLVTAWVLTGNGVNPSMTYELVRDKEACIAASERTQEMLEHIESVQAWSMDCQPMKEMK